MVLLLGDGAFGFSGMELDTLARHGVAVVAVIGNNGIWALEKHPMEALYGYSVAAELRPATRYDQVAEALGCHGELVSDAGRAAAGARAGAGQRRAGARQRADGSDRGLPAPLEPGVGVRRRRSAPRADGGACAQPAVGCIAPDAHARLRYENRPHSQRAASDPGLAQSGRAGVRARKGRLEWLGRREAPMSAASPEPMLGAKDEPGPAAIIPD